MRYFLIMLTIILSISCKETDIEKYKFIESIIKHPDSLEYMIKNSKYYSETHTSKWDMATDHLNSMKNHIKKCKLDDYEITKDEYVKVFDSELKKYKYLHDVVIKNSNDEKGKTCNLYFTFVRVENIWYLDFIDTSDPNNPDL